MPIPEAFLENLWLIIWVLAVAAGILCFLYPFLEKEGKEAKEPEPSRRSKSP